MYLWYNLGGLLDVVRLLFMLFSCCIAVLTVLLLLASLHFDSVSIYYVFCCEVSLLTAKDTNCSTRLETRTKEFNSSASRSVLTKHDRRSESNFVWEILGLIALLHPRPTRYKSLTLSVLKLCGRATEHLCWDPKDGELCSSMVKPGEILVEACVVRNWRANRYRLTRV